MIHRIGTEEELKEMPGKSEEFKDTPGVIVFKRSISVAPQYRICTRAYMDKVLRHVYEKKIALCLIKVSNVAYEGYYTPIAWSAGFENSKTISFANKTGHANGFKTSEISEISPAHGFDIPDLSEQ